MSVAARTSTISQTDPHFYSALLIMLMTNNRRIMGERVNGAELNVLGWLTTAAIFAATIGLVVTWFM
jgi:Mn2+/Fe2+ NRAMP family transporter